MTIQSLVKTNSSAFIEIVVPTDVLKEQWQEELIQWKLFVNCKVEVVNSAIKHDTICDLLVIDECHLFAADMFSQIFNKAKYDTIMCLTGTLERLDGKEKLIKQYAPVCDEIPIELALANKWVSPVKEYLVMLDVDLTEYNNLNKKFNGYFAYFNWDFDLAMSCVKDWKTRNKYANALGVPSKDVMAVAMNWNRTMRQRKAFALSHPKKFEICKRILDARTDKKCITFSATIADSESFKSGYVLHSQKSKKSNKETITKFNTAKTGVLHTSKSADQGVDIKGLSVGIILASDSSKIRRTQRTGRIIRFEEGKEAELFTLVIKGTQEVNWINNSTKSERLITINESQLNAVLAGEPVETRTREFKSDKKYRF